MLCGAFGMRCYGLITVVLLSLVGCGPAGEATLDNATISIVIPYRPGGGFDRTVRAFAPYFAKQIGPGVTVLPENVPGAGGRRGAARVFRARPDGTTLGIFNLPGIVIPEVLGEKVDYDLLALSWIGRIESQNYVLLISATSGIGSLANLQATEDIVFLSTGYGSTVLAASQIIAERIGLADDDPTYVVGYTGTADSQVGLIRGDGNVTLAPMSSAITYIEAGDLLPLAVTGKTSSIAGVPTFDELGFPELASLGLQRSLAGPPGMDPALLQTLRAAFLRAMADPDFIATAGSVRLDLSPLDGDAAAVEVAQSFAYYEKFKTNLANPHVD